MNMLYRIASGDKRLIPKCPDTDAELFTRIANTFGISVNGWTDQDKAKAYGMLKGRVAKEVENDQTRPADLQRR